MRREVGFEVPSAVVAMHFEGKGVDGDFRALEDGACGSDVECFLKVVVGGSEGFRDAEFEGDDFAVTGGCGLGLEFLDYGGQGGKLVHLVPLDDGDSRDMPPLYRKRGGETTRAIDTQREL